MRVRVTSALVLTTVAALAAALLTVVEGAAPETASATTPAAAVVKSAAISAPAALAAAKKKKKPPVVRLKMPTTTVSNQFTSKARVVVKAPRRLSVGVIRVKKGKRVLASVKVKRARKHSVVLTLPKLRVGKHRIRAVFRGKRTADRARSAVTLVYSVRGCAGKPSMCGFPDASNTGPRKGVTLRKSGSVTADEDGQVISGLDIRGEINVTAPNVTIRDVRVTGGRGAGSDDWVLIVRPGARNLTITDSEFTTPAGSEQDNACIFNISAEKPTIRRVDIHGCSAGVSSGGGKIEDSYIHDMSAVPGLSHVVGIASNGGGGLIARHNTVLNQFDQTAAIAMYQDFGTQRNNLIENNILAGGGYCVYGGKGTKGATANIRFIRNRFARIYSSKCGHYGVVASFERADPGNRWEGNRWDDTARLVG